ncbi:MAG: ChaN family lipoprotein, partial [Pirellulaceae bacterium]
VYLPRTTTAPKDAYWQNFMESMKGHGGTDGDDRMSSFYASQCLKDDAMAESITDYLAVNSHQPKVVVHLCGHFHSDYGLGTAARVAQRRPLTHIGVVTMESIPDDGERDVEVARARGHYVFWTVKN